MVLTGFDVGSKHVGDGAPCLIVAEVAQAHEGSLQIAHAYIDAIADAGADAVKFQCHIAEAESTPDEPWRVEPRWPIDRDRYHYWKRMEFNSVQWNSLAAHAFARGLAFIVSPFSIEAVALLKGQVNAWKVASGEILNDELLTAIIRTGKTAIISTGMASHIEIQCVANRFRGTGVKHVLLACTSEYPTRAEHVGLHNMLTFDQRYPFGLSDHSGTIWPALAAVTLGASIVEVHVKLSKYDQGFDASSSITIDQLADLVAGVRFIEKARQPVDKDALARELEPMRRLFLDKHKRRAALA